MSNGIPLNEYLQSAPDRVKDTIRDLRTLTGYDLSNAEFKRQSVTSDADFITPGEHAAVKYISTRDVDRTGEVMVPSGCVTKQYEMNPVVL